MCFVSCLKSHHQVDKVPKNIAVFNTFVILHCPCMRLRYQITAYKELLCLTAPTVTSV